MVSGGRTRTNELTEDIHFYSLWGASQRSATAAHCRSSCTCIVIPEIFSAFNLTQLTKMHFAKLALQLLKIYIVSSW